MDPDELIQMLNMLSPSEQDEIMGELGITDSDLYAMQGGGAGQFSEFDFGEAMPEFAPGTGDVMALGTANYPQFTAKGALDPFDLTQATQRYGLLGNQATRMVDPSVMAMLGSDPGMFSPTAFEPSVTMPTERLRTPGAELLSGYMEGGTDTFEGYLAEKMMVDKMSPAAAVRQLLADINQPDSDELPEADRLRKQALIDSMAGYDLEAQAAASGQPRAPSTSEGPSYDVKGLTDLASDWYKELKSDPLEGEGWTDPNTGVRYTEAPIVEPSAQTEWYTQRGIPVPTESYSDPEYIDRLIAEAAPTYGADQAAHNKTLAETAGQAEQAMQASRNAGLDLSELVQAYSDMTPGSYAAGDPIAAAQRSPSVSPERLAGPRVNARGMGLPRTPAAPGQQVSPGQAASSFGGAPGTPQRMTEEEVAANRAAFRQGNLADIFQRNLASQYVPPSFGEDAPYVKGDQVIHGTPGEPGFNFGQFAATSGPLRQMRQSDIEPARQRAATAQREAVGAQGRAYQATQALAPGQEAAMRALASAHTATRQGRTPTRDAVMKRLMGMRMLTGL